MIGLKQFEPGWNRRSHADRQRISNWTPQHYAPRGAKRHRLCPPDRQLLLFYLEQCEANLTTLTNAVDAFFTAAGTNQPPRSSHWRTASLSS
uniref:Breast cancer anti-estrogen resistance protein 1 n=1 Tax=Sphaerodactylus townsendi TaxID=933632 RepID=A0ACB8EA12_9SAUR